MTGKKKTKVKTRTIIVRPAQILSTTTPVGDNTLRVQVVRPGLPHRFWVTAELVCDEVYRDDVMPISWTFFLNHKEADHLVAELAKASGYDVTGYTHSRTPLRHYVRRIRSGRFKIVFFPRKDGPLNRMIVSHAAAQQILSWLADQMEWDLTE